MTSIANLNLVVAMFNVILLVSAFTLCINGGVTSSKIERQLAVYPGDMPLDSDVFKVPNGYNAPQQANNLQLLMLYCIVACKYL